MSELNTNQRKVLREVLSPESKTAGQIAQAVGLAEITVNKYMGDPSFKKEMNKQLDIQIAQANAVLASGTTAALNTLLDIIKDKDANKNLKRLAACNWLDYRLKFASQQQLVDRIDELEKVVYGG